MSSNDITIVKEELDAFDEIFYAQHGVGDEPNEADLDKSLDVIRRQLNPKECSRQEIIFARFIAKGMTQTDAYKKAFNVVPQDLDVKDPVKYCSNAAYRIAKRPRVAREIFAQKEKFFNLSLQELPDLIEELDEDRQLARALGQPAAAISAVKAKASLLGLDQKHNITTNISLDLKDEQKAALLNRIKGSFPKEETSHKVIDADFVDVTPYE